MYYTSDVRLANLTIIDGAALRRELIATGAIIPPPANPTAYLTRYERARDAAVLDLDDWGRYLGARRAEAADRCPDTISCTDSLASFLAMPRRRTP